MTYSKHEAIAILADYGMESQDEMSLALAGHLAIGADQDPAEAVNDTFRRTSLDRLSLYEWFDNPALTQRIEERVMLQENFEPYANLARRTESPLLLRQPFYRISGRS